MKGGIKRANFPGVYGQKVYLYGTVNYDNKLYHVVRYRNGRWGCNCLDHLFRKKECKHIKYLKYLAKGL